MQEKDFLPKQVWFKRSFKIKILIFTDIEAGTIISFYNGLKVKSDSDWERPTPYKMFLEDNYDIDIPDSMTCLSNYNATLGHKVMMTYILLQLYKCDDNEQVKVMVILDFSNVLLRCVIASSQTVKQMSSIIPDLD